MDNFPSRRNIFVFLFLAIIAGAIPVSLKLVQNQTQLKSRAAGEQIILSPSTLTKGSFGYDGFTVYVTANSSWKLFFCTIGTSCTLGGQGWYLMGSGSGNGNASLTPSVEYTGSHKIILTDENAVTSLAETTLNLQGGETSTAPAPAAPAPVPAPPAAAPAPAAPVTPGSTTGGGTVCTQSYDGRSLANESPEAQNAYAGNEVLWIQDHNKEIVSKNPGVPACDKQILWTQPCTAIYQYVRYGGGEAAAPGKWVADHNQEINNCPTSGTPPTGGTPPTTCIQVITPAKNPTTGECKDFPTPCDVPNGWTKVSTCSASDGTCPAGTTYTISGKVTNNNQPIAGAKVCLDPVKDGTCDGKTAFTTDSSGNYTIPGVVPPIGGAGHNVYLAADSLGAVVAPANIATQLVKPSVCANKTINFALSTGTAGLKTKCYVLSENTAAVNAVASCNDPLAVTWTGTVTLPQVFAASTTAVKKTFSVKFINTAGVASRTFTSQEITYNPAAAASTAPTITNVSCQQNLITITGTNFGIQGTGRVTANGQPTTVGTWNSANNTITAIPTQLLDGNVPIVITLGNNQTVSGQCTVNTTTVAFTAVNSCRQPGNFAADNVSAKIYDVTSTDANGTPLVEKTISLDKNGKPVNFAPKLSQGKQYTLIAKAPNTVARAKPFTPTGGTYNLPVIILPAGDIYPLVAPDGHINQFDINELKRQWSIGADVNRLADLNGDSRVNSLDYSCAINNNALKDDVFTPATLPTAADSTAASTSPTVTTITPANALISTAVTITGVNFGAVTTGTVNFYAASATSPTATAGVNSWTDTQITATIPGALTPSTQYSVEVVTAAGVKSAKTNYFVGP